VCCAHLVSAELEKISMRLGCAMKNSLLMRVKLNGKRYIFVCIHNRNKKKRVYSNPRKMTSMSFLSISSYHLEFYEKLLFVNMYFHLCTNFDKGVSKKLFCFIKSIFFINSLCKITASYPQQIKTKISKILLAENLNNAN